MKRSILPIALAIAFAILMVRFARPVAAQSSPGDFVYKVNPPHVSLAPGSTVPTVTPVCQTSIGPLVCYSPVFLRTAYDFPSTLDGTGQTILIVDAYGSPTIAADLHTFDVTFGLPDPPSFQVYCPAGCPAFNPNNAPRDEFGWSVETSLDVEWAHAMAPGANIVLVVAPNPGGNTINVVERAAIQRFAGGVMSQSFGIPEILVHGNNAQIMQAHQNYVAARQAGITVFASAGDFGATNGFSVANASYPASDPLVTAVGGTEGNPYPAGLSTPAYGGERVWNEPQFGAATGGSPSLLFAVPSFQSGLGLSARTVPDISYNAAINGGVLVAYSALGAPGFFIVGGTSCGSPQWAAIGALANELSASQGHDSLGYINPALYDLAESGAYSTDFHDIKVGNNRLVGTPVGFSATTGYDAATGWGTPNVAHLVPDLVKQVFP